MAHTIDVTLTIPDARLDIENDEIAVTYPDGEIHRFVTDRDVLAETLRDYADDIAGLLACLDVLDEARKRHPSRLAYRDKINLLLTAAADSGSIRTDYDSMLIEDVDQIVKYVKVLDIVSPGWEKDSSKLATDMQRAADTINSTIA